MNNMVEEVIPTRHRDCPIGIFGDPSRVRESKVGKICRERASLAAKKILPTPIATTITSRLLLLPTNWPPRLSLESTDVADAFAGIANLLLLLLLLHLDQPSLVSYFSFIFVRFFFSFSFLQLFAPLKKRQRAMSTQSARSRCRRERRFCVIKIIADQLPPPSTTTTMTTTRDYFHRAPTNFKGESSPLRRGTPGICATVFFPPPGYI